MSDKIIYLDFEEPIYKLDNKIQELKACCDDGLAKNFVDFMRVSREGLV